MNDQPTGRPWALWKRKVELAAALKRGSANWGVRK